MLLNKPPSAVEIAGDLNADLVNFWTTLRDELLLTFRIEATPYDEAFFAKALEHKDAACPLVRAWCFMVRNRFSRGGLGKDFAWSDRPRGGQPGDVNAWETIGRELPAIVGRIRGVQFKNATALSLIAEHDGEDTLFYLDPPYLHETRTTRKAYAHEMTKNDHAALLDVLLGIKGTFILSGYPSLLYDQSAGIGGWHRVEFSMPNHSGQGKSKQRRVECLWSNRPFSEAL